MNRLRVWFGIEPLDVLWSAVTVAGIGWAAVIALTMPGATCG